MNANLYHSSSLRSGVSGAIAMPSAPVVPVQWIWLSSRTIETRAPATGLPSSRRVTKISVLCGLSLTVMPRFVTWIIEARTRSLRNGARSIGSPSRTAAQTIPVGRPPRAVLRSSPCDSMRSAAPPRRRSRPGSCRASGWGSAGATRAPASTRAARPRRPLPDVPKVPRVERQHAGRRSFSHTPCPSPKLTNGRWCQFSTSPTHV